MASKVIRRSKSDPNALFRRKYVSYDGKLFIKKGHEDDDEEELLGGTEDHRRFRKRKPAEGVKRGLRVTKAYLVNEDEDSLSTEGGDNQKLRRNKDFDRRHTVGGALTTVQEEETEEQEIQSDDWKKDVLIKFLEDKYQQHSASTENVKMDAPDDQSYTNGYVETDLDDTMSEIDTAATGGFKRGGRARASLPVVRHAVNKSKDKPLGLIYLQYMNETKRALMPNEITGMDTVRALFVRSFKGRLNMEMLEVPARKIYIRDPLTEIFYELENPHEVKDRTVLRIYEPGLQDSTDGQFLRSSASTPVDMSYLSEPEVDQQVRQRRYHTMTMPAVHEREVDSRVRTKSDGASYNKQTSPAQKQNNVPNGQKQQSPEKRQAAPPQYFQRGAPERATVGGTAPQRPSHNQAPFQRGTPGRASATLPRGGEPPRGEISERRVGLPQGHPAGQRDKQLADSRMNGSPGGRPIPSGSKTLPPGASLDAPRSSASPPDSQPAGAQRSDSRGSQVQVTRRGSEGENRPPQNPQGMRHQQSSQSYSTSPRRGPPQQNGTHQTMQGHRSQPDLRAMQNSQSAIQPPHQSEDDTSRKIASMEAQIANLAGMVRTALHHGGSKSNGGSPVRTNPHMINGTVQSRPSQRKSPGPARQQPPARPNHPNGHTQGRQQPRSNHPNVPSQGRQQPRPNHPNGPLQGRQQPRPSYPNEHMQGGRPQVSTSGRSYNSVQNSPRQGRQQHHLSLPQSSPAHQEFDEDMTKTLNLIPAQVEFIPPTGEPTTPNIGYIKTSDDSNSSKKTTLQRRPKGQDSASTRNHLTRSIRQLRDDHRNVRKMHLHMVQQMNDSFRSTSHKIRQALDSKPGLHDHPIRGERSQVVGEVSKYRQKKDGIDRELRQLESRVEKLRLDTVNSRSQVDIRSVDNLAKLLGNSSRLIAEQKAIFPVLADKLKAVMEGEMEIVVGEEKFLRDEPGILDDYFKRCKKLTGTLYTLKRLAEVQDLQGSKTDLSSESQIKASNQSELLQVQIETKSSTKQVPLSAEPSARFAMPLFRKRKTQHTTQMKTNRWFSSPAQKSRFEQSLRDGKKNLRTTLYSQNASLRQKRHITALFKQEHHDKMTPIVTPEKEARKQSIKKKGPPPPPPPRRSSSSVKVSPQVTPYDTFHPGEAIIDKQEVQVKEISGAGSVPDLSNLSEDILVEGTHHSNTLSFSSGDLLHPQTRSSDSPSPSCTQSVLSKSCDSNLHDAHQVVVHHVGASSAPYEHPNHVHAQNVRNIRVDQHGFRAIQNGVSEPDIISSSGHRGPPKPPRGNLIEQMGGITKDPKSAFQVVAPRARSIAAHSGIRDTLSSRSTIPLPSRKRATMHMHPRPIPNNRPPQQHALCTDTTLSRTSTPNVSIPQRQIETVVLQSTIPSSAKGDVANDARGSNLQPSDAHAEKTKQLKEQYARLRALQQGSHKKGDERVSEETVPEDGLNVEPPPVNNPVQETLQKEVLIEGKRSLKTSEDKPEDSIDKALSDLESFALLAGEFCNSYEEDTPTKDKDITVESQNPSSQSGPNRPDVPGTVLHLPHNIQAGPHSDGEGALKAALDDLISSNNNLGETSRQKSGDVHHKAEKKSILKKSDFGGRQDADERLRDIHTTSRNIILKSVSPTGNDGEHHLAGDGSRHSKKNLSSDEKKQESEVMRIHSQQITIKSPRGEIEETFIF